MHILELPTFFPPYGGMFCIDQSLALAAQGNTVRIVTNLALSARLTPWLYLTAPWRTTITSVLGLEVMRFYMRGIPFSKHLHEELWVKLTCKLVDKYVEKYGTPDIIHAHCCQWAGYAAMLSARKYGVPYVITEHLSSQIITRKYEKDIRRAWQPPFLSEAYKNASLVIPVSPELVDDLKPIVGDDYKWLSVSNTIDTHFFAYKKRQPMEKREYRLCCLANFVPRKGYDVLFDAVRRYIDETGDRVKLTVAGKFMEGNGIRQMISERRLDDVVDVCGEVDKEEVRRILYNSDCLLLATRNEAQGLVLLESMSTGIPVIATDSVPDNVRIEGGCFIVPTDDHVAMAEKLRQLRHEGVNDCRGASQEVAARVSPEVIGKRLNDLFLEVVQGTRA